MKYRLLTLLFVLISVFVLAHPMPHSTMRLEVQDRTIHVQLNIPENDLMIAMPSGSITDEAIQQYITKHFDISLADGTKLRKKINRIALLETKDSLTGRFREYVINGDFYNPESNDLNTFIINYDAVIHQLPAHQTMVSVSVLEKGILKNKQLGVIAIDKDRRKINPLHISLQKNITSEFFGMFKTGMKHIAEGTDHLLFILTLLIPASLLVDRKSWGRYGGIKRYIKKIFLIVTSFTVGHSTTLIIIALINVNVPQKPVEVIIALSIVVSAVHCLIPIFYQRENLIALFFGLVHGMAFAQILQQLKPDTLQFIWNVLAFNLGIEAMQLIVIFLFLPGLLILSPLKSFHKIRVTFGVAALCLSLIWLTERLLDKDFGVGNYVMEISENGVIIGISFFVLSLVLSFIEKRARD